MDGSICGQRRGNGGFPGSIRPAPPVAGPVPSRSLPPTPSGSPSGRMDGYRAATALAYWRVKPTEAPRGPGFSAMGRASAGLQACAAQTRDKSQPVMSHLGGTLMAGR